MSFSEWLVFVLIVQIVHFIGTWRLYSLAGRKPWEALIPLYNAIILMKIIKKPVWWVILLFFPVINLLIFGDIPINYSNFNHYGYPNNEVFKLFCC